MRTVRHCRSGRRAGRTHSLRRRSALSLGVPRRSTNFVMAETLALILWIWIETTRATLRKVRSASGARRRESVYECSRGKERERGRTGGDCGVTSEGSAFPKASL